MVCAAEPPKTGRQPDSVKKRERQNDVHRIRNHARKAEMRTRMKKVYNAQWRAHPFLGFSLIKVLPLKILLTLCGENGESLPSDKHMLLKS